MLTSRPVQLSPPVEALIEEGQRAERAGQREMARRRYESALYLLRGDSQALATSLLRWIGRTYFDESQFEVATDCLTAALAVAEACDDAVGVAHALNQLGVGAWMRGELDRADEHYLRATESASRANEPRLQAMIAQNRGIVANTRNDARAALEHYGAALRLYGTLGLDELRGGILNNLGLTYAGLDRLDEAQAAFEEALTICDVGGDMHARLMVRKNLADLWLARGDLERATARCDEVLQGAVEYNQLDALAMGHKLRGIIARRRGDLVAAEADLAEAFSIATSREDLLVAAETAREQAELFEALGRNRESLQALGLAHRLFGKLRARRDLADLSRRVERLEERFVDVVSRWAENIESKDPYTRGHCERVAEHACGLARAVGFDDMAMFWFRIGALLHDVGKIEVPSEILNKSGKLTSEERAVMERHPVAGVELLHEIDFPWDVLPMIRGHHERWDGTGYPDRLAGEAIPLAARIICVADVYDALTTDRPYRPAFSKHEALAMMAADVGRMFDPQLFTHFARMMATPASLRPSGAWHQSAEFAG